MNSDNDGALLCGSGVLCSTYIRKNDGTADIKVWRLLANSTKILSATINRPQASKETWNFTPDNKSLHFYEAGSSLPTLRFFSVTNRKLTRILRNITTLPADFSSEAYYVSFDCKKVLSYITNTTLDVTDIERGDTQHVIWGWKMENFGDNAKYDRIPFQFESSSATYGPPVATTVSRFKVSLSARDANCAPVPARDIILPSDNSLADI